MSRSTAFQGDLQQHRAHGSIHSLNEEMTSSHIVR